MNKQTSDAFSVLFAFLFVEVLALDLREDNLWDVLWEPIEYLNTQYSGCFRIIYTSPQPPLNENGLKRGVETCKIYVSIIDYYKISELDPNIIKSLEILTFKTIDDEIIEYIETNLEGHYKYKMKILFLTIMWKIGRSAFLYKYSSSQANEVLRTILLVIYYWVGAYDINTLKKSIEFIDVLVERYPNIISFYLLRMRQKFDLLYRCVLWKTKYNKLVSTEKWRDFIYKQSLTQECFADLEKADSVYPNNSTYYYFKGKFLLHLLDDSGIEDLYKFLEIKGLFYDFDVYSWIGVYYLQVGDSKKADFYINIANYDIWDKYKQYAKQIFYQVLEEDFTRFQYFLKKRYFQAFLFRKGKYYNLIDEKVQEIDFNDSVNLSAKMWFKINNLDVLLHTEFENEKTFLEGVYENISRHFYDHWNSDICDKVVFVYPEYKGLMWNTIAKGEEENK